MVINQIVWRRAEADGQTILYGGQTAHQTKAGSSTNRGWWLGEFCFGSLVSVEVLKIVRILS
jgi:hypothetical protein